jgi:hypothetical protein
LPSEGGNPHVRIRIVRRGGANFPTRTGEGKGKRVDLALARLVKSFGVLMAFLRRHHNGVQVFIDRQSTADGYLWVVYSIGEDGLIGLTAPSLNEARGIADSLAVVSHVAECNEACNDWELLKREQHG